MRIRSIMSVGMALLLVSAATATAHGVHPGSPGKSRPTVQHAGFLGLFNKGQDDAPVTLAQADPRVPQLEEEIRKLSGTIEELNFQVLQMQEQLRKMQEDNEFRFQQLEGGGAGAAKKSGAVTPPKTEAQPPATGTQGDTAAVAPGGETGSQATGVPGVELGTLTVDQDGNVKSSTMDQPAGQNRSADGTTVAALPSSDDPDELYRNAYEFVLSGDYPTAEAGFRDHIARFPADPKTADARYWLGESLLGQQKYRDAAEIFLAASKEYPKAGKAPDMLLKLGVSLKALDQHDVACATFKEVGKRYPNASDALKQRVKQEQALAAC